MTSFSLEKSLPSVKVTKSLILNLQRSLLEKRSKIVSSSQQDFRFDEFSVSIVDDIGQGKVESMEEWHLDRFLDGTKRVTIHCDSYSQSRKFSATIVFDRERSWSRIQISATCEGACDVVIAAQRAVFEWLEPAKTTNWRYQPTLFFQGLGAVAFGSTATGAIRIVEVSPRLTTPLIVLSLALGAYLWLGPRFYPFTTFDSSLADRRGKTADWFEKGLFTFLVFGILFTFLRKSALGF